MKLLRWIFISTGIAVGCATVSTKDLMPPDANLLPPNVSAHTDEKTAQQDRYLLDLLEQDNEAKNIQWWVKYKRAQLWAKEKPETSCGLYTEMALENRFPLRPLAYLRAQEVCPAQAQELAALGEFKPGGFAPWLKDLATDISLDSYERNDNKEKLMSALFEKSKQKLPQREKVDFTKRALALAKELHKEEESTTYQERLYELAPRLNPEPKPEDYDRVAYDFRRARSFTKARHYYRLILKDKKASFSEKVSALKGIRMAYKLQRDKKSYLKATRELTDFVSRYYKGRSRSSYFRRVYHDTHITLARTLWTLNHVTEARKTLIKLEKKLRGRYPLATVFWLRGRMAEEKQNFAEAIEWFSKAVADLTGPSEFKEDILWYKAWNLRKLKRYKEAIESFEELVASTDSPYRKPRYRFWLARTLSDHGEGIRAHVEYKNLIKEDPIGYYGLLAHRQISQPVESPVLERSLASKEKQKSLRHLEDVMKPELIEWLISVDEIQVARDYLDHVSASYRKSEDQDEEVWLDLFRYYAHSGSYLNLYIQLGQLDAERRNGILSRHPELVFPQPFVDQVQKAASEYDVNPNLVYSIMRQESAFNPNARSHADAFGLLQLLPEVAKKSAAKIGVPYREPEDLFKPQINIPIGSAFIKELWEKYNGQFILAVASYNASDEAIQGWLKTRYRGDALEFIEDIPYEETRGYVRLVMRNLIFYSLLNSEEGKIEFPEWCLKVEEA